MGQSKQRKALMGENTVRLNRVYPYPTQFELRPLEEIVEELKEKGVDSATINYSISTYPRWVERYKKDAASWDSLVYLSKKSTQKDIQLLCQGILSHSGKSDFTKEGVEKIKQSAREIVARYHPFANYAVMRMQSVLSLVPPSLQGSVEILWHGIGDWRC